VASQTRQVLHSGHPTYSSDTSRWPLSNPWVLASALSFESFSSSEPVREDMAPDMAPLRSGHVLLM